MHIYMMFIQKISAVGKKIPVFRFLCFLGNTLQSVSLCFDATIKKVSEITELLKRDLPNLGKILTLL